MAKRTATKNPRRKNDAYLTWDARAYPALLRRLPPHVRFIEPCAGAGHIVAALESAGHRCVAAYDIDPQAPGILRRDAHTLDSADLTRLDAECFITNPPWTRSLLEAMIRHLASIAPTWVLFDSDWAFNAGASDLLKHCVEIVAVGRLTWIEGTTADAKENCAWYLFDMGHDEGPKLINDRKK